MDSKVITGILIDNDKNMVINDLGDYFERVFSTK
jgi:hypothetical protein